MRMSKSPKSAQGHGGKARTAVRLASTYLRVASELDGNREEVERGSQLLYDGLPVHSLGEEQLCLAICEHLDRPCIKVVSLLLEDLASAAGSDVAALRRSTPGLAQRLCCLADAVEDAVRESRTFWLKLAAALAEQRAARPAHTRLVRTSQCLHCGKRKLLAKAWQTRAYDPATRPACAGLVRGVVSRERRAHFQASTSWSTSRSLAEARETLLSRFGRRLRSPASTSIIMQADVRCGPFSKFAVLSPKRCDTRPRGLGSKQSARARPGALI